MTGLLLVFAAGITGYFVFRRLRLPVPGVLGSLSFAAALNLAGFYPEFPLRYVVWFSNIVIGTYVGQKVTRTSVRFLRDLPVPALTISAGMLVISLAGGGLLYLMSDLSPVTALLGSTAGGISEMALLSMSLGADVASVTLLQVFRLLAAILATPVFCRRWTAWCEGRTQAAVSCPCPLPREIRDMGADDDLPPPRGENRPSARGFAVLAAAALAGGFTGYRLHLPVGILTGAMFAVSAMNLAGKEQPPLPGGLRTSAQIGIGIIIAANITLDTLRQFTTMAGPVILITFAMLAASLSLGFLLHRMTGWNYPTCLLSTSLGGLSQMSIISEEMGADPLKVSILQTVRLVTILMVFPLLMTFLFG
ncbi:MAG: AbrB family transcriptional regulator [Synergistales bacterium]|nr:AbrB family transcriptional regulator [Synergistales bacterium]